MDDLINFDIIETHKENIQSLPQGRSAKALASALGPPSLFSPVQTPGSTRNINDTIRQEFELELEAISDSDDPLDIYDRYVKWTLNAFPFAQATPDSQLRSLLERATKAFQTASHYKNDPRYLKLWLSYIRFFSDAPKETFAYLARHNIGEGLALFYEEFAAWLEGAERWTQAEEVYKLGIEREARPTERLLRKFGEFQHRFEQRPQVDNEPVSPALPTVRPALVAKIDPFALSTPRPLDPQAQRFPSATGTSSISRGGRQKLAIFSDADALSSDSKVSAGTMSKGWDNIGTIQERKKENVMEARPWAGETLKVAKKVGGPPKMMIFRDESRQQKSNIHSSSTSSNCVEQQQVVNPRIGKVERVFVNLEAVYPNPTNLNEEYSFEELRAKRRGWLDKQWAPDKSIAREINQLRKDDIQLKPENVETKSEEYIDALLSQEIQESLSLEDDGCDITVPGSGDIRDSSRENKAGRLRKKRVMEVKGETQTIKTNLASPTGPKLRRKNSAEPTMTIHTRAATDDILDIFSQPLRNLGPIGSQADSDRESDYDEDDYTSAGESTCTGRISGTSEFGDDETEVRTTPAPDTTEAKSVSEWSNFTASKHLPRANTDLMGDDPSDYLEEKSDEAVDEIQGGEPVNELVTPVSPGLNHEIIRTKFVPIPPEDYEPPTRPYRDPAQVSQSRLPFMTPIVEKTESSVGILTIRGENDYFSSKTPPGRKCDEISLVSKAEDAPLSSPFQEIVNEASTERQKQILAKKASTVQPSVDTKPAIKGPIIKDTQCNPVDDAVRSLILENVNPPLKSLAGYNDHRPQFCGKGPEIRKYVKALTKVSKNASDKTMTNLSIPPTLQLPSAKPYTIKRELGKGAFALVYLAEQETSEQSDSMPLLSAIKAEDPPTPWEFYIMSTAHRRLGLSRATASLAIPHSMHIFADEGYLVESYHDQGTLLDLVNLARSDPTTTPLGVDEPIAMFFAIELLRTLEALHAKGLLHGDLKADNCLVRLPPTADDDVWDAVYSPQGLRGWADKGLTLIDFGRGIDLRAFGPDVQFVADWKTTKQDCAAMREMRPWTFQVDYWGAAGVIHVLLFGKWIEDVLEKNTAPTTAMTTASGTGFGDGAVGGLKRYRLKEGLKRYWATDIWQGVFDSLLNPTAWVGGEEGGKMPVTRRLRSVREGMEGWLVENGERRGLKVGLRRLEERIRERRR